MKLIRASKSIHHVERSPVFKYRDWCRCWNRDSSLVEIITERVIQIIYEQPSQVSYSKATITKVFRCFKIFNSVIFLNEKSPDINSRNRAWEICFHHHQSYSFPSR